MLSAGDAHLFDILITHYGLENGRAIEIGLGGASMEQIGSDAIVVAKLALVASVIAFGVLSANKLSDQVRWENFEVALNAHNMIVWSVVAWNLLNVIYQNA